VACVCVCVCVCVCSWTTVWARGASARQTLPGLPWQRKQAVLPCGAGAHTPSGLCAIWANAQQPSQGQPTVTQRTSWGSCLRPQRIGVHLSHTHIPADHTVCSRVRSQGGQCHNYWCHPLTPKGETQKRYDGTYGPQISLAMTLCQSPRLHHARGFVGGASPSPPCARASA